MRNYNICNVCKSCISCKKSVVSPFCWDQLSKEQINNIWRVDLVFIIFIIKINIFIFGYLNIAIGGEYVRFGIENGPLKYRTFLKANIFIYIYIIILLFYVVLYVIFYVVYIKNLIIGTLMTEGWRNKTIARLFGGEPEFWKDLRKSL
jgi:hypothetical protein